MKKVKVLIVCDSASSIRRPLMMWIPACSSDEEPYTLVMIFDVFSQKVQGFKSLVLGTDIPTRMIETARCGIYYEERVVPIPIELREHMRFPRLNFMDGDFGMREKMDIIFCRNVLICFDKSTQEKVINRLCNHFHAGSYLFTGHSETLSSMNVPLETVANTVSRGL
jgi:chemotaxis protein methyltransferase CheR